MFPAAVLAVASALLACSPGHAAPAAPNQSVGQQLHRPVPKAARESTLVDPTGRSVRLSSLAGKIVVLSDMMTLCQETCPLDTAEVVDAARAVERAGLASKVVFLSVTIDPLRDTPARIAAYQRLFAPVPADWLVLTGSASDLAVFWKQLGVYIEKAPEGRPPATDWLSGAPLRYDITHSDDVFYIDASGIERFVLVGSPHVAAGTSLPPALDRFLNGEGRRNLNRPPSTAWTLGGELAALSWLLGRTVPRAPDR